MKNILSCLLSVLFLNFVWTLNPSVYVVTPSSRSYNDEGRSAPFYYHNWMRRMDTPQNATASTITTTQKTTTKTPDLIFAEFESDNGDNMKKSIRNLLEKERVVKTTTSTTPSISHPIYVPDEDTSDVKESNIEISLPNSPKTDSERDMTDYFALYNNLYGNDNNLPVIESASSYQSTSTTTTTTVTPPTGDIENIWHIIDSEKHDKYPGNWEEVPVDSNKNQQNTNQEKINDSFALPGFAANPGNGAENESRAIRTEPNIRFPYVSLKPFQMKNVNKPLINSYTNSKKGNNMFTSLDNYQEVTNPVRGEAQDVVSMRLPIDRYNPAQPYLPQEYGSKSKQSNPAPTSTKTVANLVPPPPPPPPKVTGDDFPVPTNYESFPPYAPAMPDIASIPSSPVQNIPPITYQSPNNPVSSQDSKPPISAEGDAPMDLGYRYKQPTFVPTLPPLTKPFSGFSYNKPSNAPPAMNGEGYMYKQPSMTMDVPPIIDTDSYKPSEDHHSESDDKPDFHGYHYSKPTLSEDLPPASYGLYDFSPHHHDGDFPELIFDKPHANADDGKMGGNGMKDNDVGMMPPPLPADMKPDPGSPMDNHGFPPDFPSDLKFYHDFDDHDFHHHHHHPTTTTTTTTEMPRVNRYSYYYLGKKLYYLPLYFSVYFIVYVGALIIKAVLRHKIVYPNSWRPNDTTASFFAKRSVDSINSSLSNENLHELTGRVTKAIGEAAEKYMNNTESE